MKFKNLLHLLKCNFWDILIILILVGASSFLAFKNFTPGTWLLGWDDLVPELNFKLNIARSLSAVWQEYQGVGLLGGMSHATALPRELILWLFSFVIPTSFLRYLWTFLMLVLGPVGVYWLVRVVHSGPATRQPQIHPQGDTPALGFPVSCHPINQFAAFSAAIFYLFNLSTVQTFYTPFEAFVSFFGFVPWLLYFAIRYLKDGKRANLLVFALISFVGASAFYVQTLFVVYAIFLIVFAIETIIKRGKTGIVLSISLGIVTLCINAFWLLPVVYFSVTGAGVVANSHINSIATPETQLMSQARANFADIATLKGYWFDYFDWSKNGTSYDYLYKVWISYSNQLIVEKISLGLFAVSVLGLILSLFKKKTSYGLSFLILLGISYFMLNGGTVPFIPLFSEIFRNAFTKWSNAYALILSVSIGYFVFAITDLFRNKFVKYAISILLTAVIVLESVYTVWPVFQGNLISQSMKVNVPSYYFDTINYFKTQDPTKRIADFPLTDFWGWQFTDWGYRGSGFLWYGIPQPILSRTFDVWSKYNENFYSEISRAMETKNQDEVKYVLNKYQVNYILFDSSVIQPGNNNSMESLQNQKNFLDSLTFLSKKQELGRISIYEFDLGEVNSFVSTPTVDYSSNYVVPDQNLGIEISESFPDAQGYRLSKNCDVKGRGEVQKKKLSGGNYYKADGGGVSCDYFYYPTLDSSKAYSMRITGKNINGRSLEFYLYNVKTKNIDMQELLPVGNFDKSYSILPTESSSSAGFGYTLSVETKSFGNVKSENLITGITFAPLDFHTLQGASLQGNNLQIQNVQKFGTWGYKVETNGSGLIELGQGYDTGWVAFPFLEHVKVNSWSNGWLVPQTQNPDSKFQIIIIFWPQLLEWGGMLAGVITLSVLFFPKKRQNLSS